MTYPFTCIHCGQVFKSRATLVNHYKNHQPHPKISRRAFVSQRGKTMFTCIHCGEVFKARAKLVNHYRNHQPHPKISRRAFISTKTEFTCIYCAAVFLSREELRSHLDIHPRRPECVAFEDELKGQLEGEMKCEFVHEETHREYTRKAICKDPSHALDLLRQPLKNLLTTCLEQLTNCKFQLCLTISLSRGEKTSELGGFWSFFEPLYNAGDISDVLNAAYTKIREAIDSYAENGSGWTIVQVESMTVKVAKIDPFRACSFIPLPKHLHKKSGAIVNVQNRDNKCFLYSVLAAKTNSYETDVNHYESLVDTVDHSVLKFPTALNHIDAFERVNQLSINVIGYTSEIGLHPLRVNKNPTGQVVDLLLLGDEKGNKHYCAILDIEQLLRFRGAGTHRKYYCRNCFGAFGKESMLMEHRDKCIKLNRAQALTFLEPGKNFLKFEHYDRRNPHPWVIYADFECILQRKHTTRPDPATSSSNETSVHSPSSFGYVVVGPYNEIVSQNYYLGMDAVDVFYKCMKQEMRKFSIKVLIPYPLKMRPEDEIRFKAENTCVYCNKLVVYAEKVRDHCHFTGEYRGAAHNECNMKARRITTIPVIFHNLERYDMHLLIMAAKEFPGTVNVIARNTERFSSMTITKRFDYSNDPFSVHLKFIDSLNFLNSSLESLARNHKKDNIPFAITETALNSVDWFDADVDTVLALMTKKGHYPYEYVDSMDVFEERNLPPREDFYSSVRGKGLSEEDYQHATTVWNLLKDKVFASYHKVYQMVDVYLLADIFQTFRKMCLTNDGIDPCYYISTPGFSWAAALKKTDVTLELFTHASKHNFIASGIRGGIAYVSKRHSVANNKYLPDTYDPSRPSLYLIDLDINNLYGLAMTEYLPYDQFRWMKKEEILAFDLSSIEKDSEFGYILEVDLDYPSHLHDDHNDYPLAPEQLTITPDFVSPFMKNIASKKITSSMKLTTNLLPKRNYIVHYRTLQFYLKHGLVLKCIRRILSFRQKQWLKSYIDFNTEKRQTATANNVKDFYKLKNNSVFGKTLENKSKRVSVKLSTDMRKSVKYSSLPHADSFKILNENLVQFNLRVRNVKCDLPTYTGFTILELSKLSMYEFHYEFMRFKYGNRAKLLLTDTDSLFYEVETVDFYEDMKLEHERFDTSNYDSSHPLFSLDNKQVLGKMKDETAGIPVKEFIGLKAKMYSMLVGDDSLRKAKGINKAIVKKSISHDDYVKALFSKEPSRATWTSIRSKQHVLSTVEISKSSISPYDDKRYVLDDGITTLAHGHYKSGMECKPSDTPVILIEDEEADEQSVTEVNEEPTKEQPKCNTSEKSAKRKRHTLEDVDEKRERLANDAAKARLRRAQESEKEKEERLAKDAANARLRRARETEKEKEERLAKDAAKARLRRARETEKKKKALQRMLQS